MNLTRQSIRLLCLALTWACAAGSWAAAANSGLGAIRNLDYTIVICDDINEMRQFYKDVMQFEIFRETPGQWIEFQVGSSLLTLRPRNRPYDGPPVTKAAASLQLAFRVPPKEVDHAYETLKSHNVHIIEPPKDQVWGHRTLFFFDPENNVIELYADI